MCKDGMRGILTMSILADAYNMLSYVHICNVFVCHLTNIHPHCFLAACIFICSLASAAEECGGCTC